MKKTLAIVSGSIVSLVIAIYVYNLKKHRLTLSELQPLSLRTNTPETLCDFPKALKIIDDIYTNNNIHGFGASEEVRTLIASQGGDATYGEITQESVHALLKDLSLTEQDTVYDLGSGVGKFCMQVALTTPAKVIGVELSPKRFSDAQKAVELLRHKHGIDLKDRLQFIEQNILNVSLQANAVVYLCSTCYPDSLMDGILNILKKTPGSKRVLSTKDLPELTPIKRYTLPMTWDQNANVSFYIIE